MNFDLVTLGETMLRLSPSGEQRLEQTLQLVINIGGAESNVATAVSRMGKKVSWISRLPDNPLGYQTARAIQQHGVDLSGVTWAPGERMGLYFVEFGAAPRAIRVWYDRANSAASRMKPADLPLELIASARWLHLTGITPALSADCKETTQTALAHARASGLTVSFDVNYRALLWSPEDAAVVLEPFCEQADYVIIALRDAINLFGAPTDAATALRELQSRWQGTVIVTQGDTGVMACDGQDIIACDAMATTIVDRLGAGDAFAAGLICRLLEHAPLEDALRFGTALAALKLTIPGDMALVTRAEVEALVESGAGVMHR